MDAIRTSAFSLAALVTTMTVAQADCITDLPLVDGQTVICDGTTVVEGTDATETRAIVTPQSDLTFNIEAGASWETGTASQAIRFIRNGANTVNNAGTVTGQREAFQARSNLTVNNSGTIDMLRTSIDGRGDNIVVDNAAGGLIQSLERNAINGRDGFVLTNAGTIRSGEDGIEVDAGARIENSGLIENFVEGTRAGSAVKVEDGTILNTGTIRSETEYGVSLTGGTSASYIENRGLIEGSFGIFGGDGQTKHIVNYGDIVSTARFAVRTGGGADLLELRGGRIFGDIDLHNGDDVLRGIDVSQWLPDQDMTIRGGRGLDTLVLEDWSYGDFYANTTLSQLDDDEFAMNFGGEFSLIVDSFETVTLRDQDFTFNDLMIAPIPLPASAWMLLLGCFGLCAFGHWGRRGARRARQLVKVDR